MVTIALCHRVATWSSPPALGTEHNSHGRPALDPLGHYPQDMVPGVSPCMSRPPSLARQPCTLTSPGLSWSPALLPQ